MAIRLKEDEASPMIAINTTPLIDVMLVLLIMLIITIPVELHSINLDTPDNGVTSQPSREQVITIVINRAGQYVINQTTLSDGELNQRFAELSRLPSSPEIHIQPDNQSPFKSLAHVLASAQNYKLTRIGIDDNPSP